MYKEPTTVENLKALCESELYQSMLNEFAERSNRVIANLIDDLAALLGRLAYCQRRYHILDIPFDEVLTVFEKKRDIFLDYQIAAPTLFSDDCKDAGKTGFFDTTYLIERFCEFYLLLSHMSIHSVSRPNTVYVNFPFGIKISFPCHSLEVV